MDLYFNVARHYYRISFCDEAAPYKQLIPTHGPFHLNSDAVTEEVRGSLLFHVSIGAGLVPATTDGLEMVGEFDCGNCMHHVARSNDGYRILIHNCDGRLAACLETNANFTRCSITPVGDDLCNQRFGIDNSIMIIFAFSAAYHGTLLMHSSVPVKDGRAYLFQGKSGTGKSTHCELWLKHIPGTERINDDNPVVRIMDNGEAWVFGSPWSGKTPIYMNVGYPIQGFLRLHQAPYNKIRQLSKLEGFASILSSCSTMIWDKPSYNGICDTISRVASSVGCYDLECLPDQAAAELSYGTMRA